MQILLLLVASFISFKTCLSSDFTGDKILEVLNKSKSNSKTIDFIDYWHLDKNMQNSSKGIELKINNKTALVDTIIIAGTGYKNLSSFTAALPYEITITDDIKLIKAKTSVTPLNRNSIWTFDVGMCLMSVDLNAQGKIRCIKYYSQPAEISKPITKTSSTSSTNKTQSKVLKVISNSPSQNTVVNSGKLSIENKDNTILSSILQLFKSYRESGLTSIKRGVRSQSNFWNYKYTYYTSIKIPGEKFNMLYCFPFHYSQLDFVSVLHEGNVFDESFVSAHKQMEKKLSQSLTQEKGWYSVCIPNKESKTLSDIEFRNEQTGSVILDYSKNPAGKHILYLRFLFFSN